MAQITISQQELIVDSDDALHLWHSRMEIPLGHVASAHVVNDSAPIRAWLRIGALRPDRLATSGPFMEHGRDVFCDASDFTRLVVIHLREDRYERLFANVADPEETVAKIDQALRSRQQPANTLAFLLGVIESQAELAKAFESIWERSNVSIPSGIGARPIDVARSVLGEEAFEGALAAGRAASLELQLDGHEKGKQPASDPSTERLTTSWAGIRLSAREQEVLQLLAEGCTNQQIAETLAITERTVRYHLTSIFNKLGADNRAHAVALAAQHGLLERLMA